MAKKNIVVVLGAGFGGLTFAKNFSAKNTDVILIDRQNHHLFQPLLYQVATAGLSANEIAHPIRQVFVGRKDIRVILDEIISVDLQNKTVLLKEYQNTITFDYLIIALGVNNNYYGNPKWASYTIGLKSLREALAIREKMLLCYEKAENICSDKIRKKMMTITIIGGGPTGVELAGAFAEFGKLVLKNEFINIDPRTTRVVLVEAGDRILPSFNKKLSQRAKNDLEKLGVEIKINSPVVDIEKEKVFLSNEIIETAIIIWAGGMSGVDVVQQIETPKDKNNRIFVNSDCSLKNYRNIFAIGDTACFLDKKGKYLPGVSPVAIQMGSYVAKIIKQEIKSTKKNKPRKIFKYIDKGSMATIGRKSAVATIGSFNITGLIAWVLWLFVHIFFLIGFRNRIAVLIQWFYAYINFKHGARIVFCAKARKN